MVGTKGPATANATHTAAATARGRDQEWSMRARKSRCPVRYSATPPANETAASGLMCPARSNGSVPTIVTVFFTPRASRTIPAIIGQCSTL